MKSVCLGRAAVAVIVAFGKSLNSRSRRCREAWGSFGGGDYRANSSRSAGGSASCSRERMPQPSCEG